MPKLKLTPEQKVELKSIVANMPTFPRTAPSGKPLETWAVFRGSYIFKHYESLRHRGYILIPRKEINIKDMYRVPCIIMRNNEDIAIKAMKENRVQDVIKTHYSDYTQYLKYMQTNGKKMDNTKSTK